MAIKTISNRPKFVGLFILILGQNILVGLIVIALGLAKVIDPFILTSYEYGLAIEGGVLLILGLFGGILGPTLIGSFVQDPIRFAINYDYIESIQFGALIFKSSSFIEKHPIDGLTGIELTENVRENDEGAPTITYSAKLIKGDGEAIGTIRGISSTGVAEELAEALGVNITRNFD
tara:strand:+ start:6084 stop:6611 length:528 start_codon:yes stop_codon:yes gene_type:complete